MTLGIALEPIWYFDANDAADADAATDARSERALKYVLPSHFVMASFVMAHQN